MVHVNSINYAQGTLVREKLFSERLVEPQITENKRQIQFVESFKLKRGTFFNLSEFILFEKKNTR